MDLWSVIVSNLPSHTFCFGFVINFDQAGQSALEPVSSPHLTKPYLNFRVMVIILVF